MPPRVSICVPTFNRANELRVTLKSLVNQTYQDYELIVCDDASSDDTALVVGESTDPRIRYSSNSANLGLYQNWNRCLELATGDYVAIYHDHDLYAPSIVEECVRILDLYPNVGLVHTGCVMIEPEGKVQYFVFPFPEFASGIWWARRIAQVWDSPIHAPTVMVRHQAYEKAGKYYDWSLDASADMDMWVRLGLVCDFAYIAGPLVQVTSRSVNEWTGQFRWRTLVCSVTIQRRNIERVHRSGSLSYLLALLRAFTLRDYHFVKNWVWLVYHGQDILVGEGLMLINRECSVLARLSVNLGVRLIPLLRGLVKITHPFWMLYVSLRRNCRNWRAMLLTDRRLQS